jgi:dynactin complex subunit
MTEGEKKVRTRISATQMISHARDRKKAEVDRLTGRATSLTEQLDVVTAELEDARAELAQLESALPVGKGK